MIAEAHAHAPRVQVVQALEADGERLLDADERYTLNSNHDFFYQENYIKINNRDPKPFVWSKTADEILAKRVCVLDLLERFAADGVVFEQAISPSSWTLPSHASILTGRYPFDHQVRDNAGFRLEESVETLAEAARAKGFSTGAFVGAIGAGRPPA